jgi:AraC family transcriptional regulator of adaptative response/methylated-DNA-[protein]-cysteine methyltransferase
LKTRLAAAMIRTPLGPMVAMASPEGICVLEFLNGRTTSAAVRKYAARLGGPVVAGRSAHIERLRQELDAYFRGTLRRFGASLDLRGTSFQRAVWRQLARVPYGATLTYTQLAARAGRKSAVRAAGHANGRNPVSIVVPCHRVLGRDGALHGYGGGLWRKERLIALERDVVSREGSSPRSSKRFRRGTRNGP